IRLGPGDLVPADVRLLRASGLTVHQAALTGESLPVPKQALDAPAGGGADLPEPPHLCFQGSSVAPGSATALVVATGADTRGASSLARTSGVIVKRLPALHDLGAIDVLCLDKTGTLTQDRPVVERSMDTRGGDDPEVLRWAAVNSFWTLELAELPAPDALDE